jgi:hypothetical protein
MPGPGMAERGQISSFVNRQAASQANTLGVSSDRSKATLGSSAEPGVWGPSVRAWPDYRPGGKGQRKDLNVLKRSVGDEVGNLFATALGLLLVLYCGILFVGFWSRPAS